MSLIPLIRGQGPWRDFLMIESWGAPDFSADDRQIDLGTGKDLIKPYVAIHTDQYMYIQTIGSTPELYDLEKDPDEMQNVVNSPEYAEVAKDLNARDDYYRGPFMTELARLLASLTPTPPSAPAP